MSVEPLAKLFGGNGVAVLHAAVQDLEVLDLAVGTIPTQIFDTQIAAGFLGQSSASLGSLAEKALRRRLPKGDRLTDWLARPLTAEQLDYAAADVAHLLEIHDWLCARLEPAGRREWAEEESEDLRVRGRPLRRPDDAWRRIKEVRQLRGSAFDVGRCLAAWREERAARIDQPVRFVLPDLALVAVAQRAPSSAAELRSCRGVEDRHIAGRLTDEILGVVKQAKTDPPPPPPSDVTAELDRELRPVVALIAAWVGQRAGELEIDQTLLATRGDIEALLRGDVGARLAHGWRGELLGEPIRRLVAGHDSVAFERGRGLVIEARH